MEEVEKKYYDNGNIKEERYQILGIEKTNIKKLFNQINEIDDYYDILIK